MRLHVLALAFVLAACGSSHSGSNPDGNNGGGDGSNGNGDGPGGGNPTTVMVTLVNHPTNASMYTFLAAYQDGAAAWHLAPAPSGDIYSMTINSPVWGFAWTCIDPTTKAARVQLAYFTVAEKTSITETIPAECTDRVTRVGVSGTVTNLPAQGTFLATFAARTVAVTRGTGNTGDTFTMMAASGAHDLLVTTGTLAAGSISTDTAGIVRGVTAPTTTATLDWSTAKAVTSAAVTVPTGTTGVTAATTLYTAGGTQMTLVAGSTAPYTTVGLDASLAMTGDIYDQAVVERGNGSVASVENWTTTIAAQTYTPPTPLGGATSSVPTTTPYPEIMTTWNAYSNAVGYAWDARQGGTTPGGTNVRWTTLFGPGYVGSSPKFQMPDLSGLTGWSASLQLVAGTQVVGTSAAMVSSGGASDFPPAAIAVAGTVRTTASSNWTVTP